MTGNHGFHAARRRRVRIRRRWQRTQGRDRRRPRSPGSVRGGEASLAIDAVRRGGMETSRPRSSSSPRQRGAIGRAHPAARIAAQHHLGSPGDRDAHGVGSAIGEIAGGVGPAEEAADHGVRRLHAHVPDARVAPAAARRPPRTAISPRADSRRRSSAGLRRRARAGARRRAPPSRTGPAPRRTPRWLPQAAQDRRLDVGRHDLRERAVAVENSGRRIVMASPSGASVPAGRAGSARCARPRR